MSKVQLLYLLYQTMIVYCEEETMCGAKAIRKEPGLDCIKDYHLPIVSTRAIPILEMMKPISITHNKFP